jgi:ABC-type sugar transport system substrate-binding protein
MFARVLNCHTSAFLLLIVPLSGCEQAASGPVSAVEFDRPLDSVVAAKATQVVLVLPADDTEEYRVWEQVVRSEAGLAQTIMDVRKPHAGDTSMRQAELVREAARRGASALIVVAENAEEIAPALAEVRDRGLPVVLLDRPVEITGRPLPLVTRPPFEAPARALVLAAIEEAKAWGFPPRGPALILVNSRVDAQTEARVAALKSALDAAGVKLIDAARFGVGIPMPLVSEARETVLKSVAAEPRIAMILADDEIGIGGADTARENLGARGQFALVGFTANPKTRRLVDVRACAALVDVNLIGVARQAVQTALRLIRGESVPPRIEVAYTTQRAAGPRPADAPFFKSGAKIPSSTKIALP